MRSLDVPDVFSCLFCCLFNSPYARFTNSAWTIFKFPFFNCLSKTVDTFESRWNHCKDHFRSLKGHNDLFNDTSKRILLRESKSLISIEMSVQILASKNETIFVPLYLLEVFWNYFDIILFCFVTCIYLL